MAGLQTFHSWRRHRHEIAPTTVDVTELIDSQRCRLFNWRSSCCASLIVAIDGFDTAAIGFIAPAIRAEWAARPAQLAPLFGAGCSASWSARSCSAPWPTGSAASRADVLRAVLRRWRVWSRRIAVTLKI